MKKQNKIFRNEFDYLITDTMPVEMPAPFSFASFYRWLKGKNGERMRKEIHRMKSDKSFPDFKYASFPHRFCVKKKDGSNRVLSCPSILGATLMMAFINHHQKEFLYDFSKPSFSIRKPMVNSTLHYVFAKGKGKYQTVHYISDYRDSENELLEKTGMFFDIKPLHSLSKLWKSSIWKNAWARFKGEPCIHVDIENCFPSIYSHTLGWVFPREGAESKKFAKSIDYHNALDRVVERINCNETHGIIVGPEFSRLAAETILEEIDRRAMLKLESKYRYGVDYCVLRFVDDYYIFGKSEDVRNKVLGTIEEECRSFFLKMNMFKKETISDASNGDWIPLVNGALKSWEDFCKSINPSLSRNSCLSYEKLLFQSFRLILSGYDQKTLNSIVPYILVSFSRQLKSRNFSRKLFNAPCVAYLFYCELFGFLFDVCKKAGRFYNFQSLSLTIHNIVLFSPKEKKKTIRGALEHIVSLPDVSEWLMSALDEHGFYDFLPLLLELAGNDICMPKRFIDCLMKLLNGANDPVLLACGVLILSKLNKLSLVNKIKKIVETDVINFIGSCYLPDHYRNAFLLPGIWYIYLFHRSNVISLATQNKISSFLEEVKKNNSAGITFIICEYLLSSDYCVFDWDFFSAKSQRKWHYSTNKRTNLIKGDSYA